MKSIKVNMLTRVEGEAALQITLKGDRVTDVKLNVFEPPRMFEAFLRGRHFNEAPDMVARICGICPIAYQMSAVHAFERALNIQIDPMVRMLRRLFYCGEWIESHALHVFMLHAPDFLGYPDAIQMARDHRTVVEQGLRLKKIGNSIVSLMGGREIHPVSAAVGGFYKVPAESELRSLTEDLKWALDASLATVKLVSGFEFPEFERDYEFVALSHPHEYPFNEGRIASSKGLNIFVPEYEEHFVERHVKHSNALQSLMNGRGAYFVGPLARFNINFAQLPDVAKQAAKDCGLKLPVLNPFRSIIVRAIELVFACHEALQIIADYQMPESPRADFTIRAGTGSAATEAPRGLLYHRYKIDDQGLIQFVPQVTALSSEQATWKCEQAVRNYDPCISCATHALHVRIDRA